MNDNYDEVSDTYVDKLSVGFVISVFCLISLFIGVSIGYSNGKFYGSNEIWEQAVKNDKAETLETSDGTLYRWKQ